jgi:hypothetical protein
LNIPDKVKIGWREYVISQGEHRSGSKGGDLYGEIEYEEQTIYLYDKQGEENKSATLLHEIIHGIFYISGHDKWRENEELINTIAENLYQVIKDNPDIFK